MPPLRVLLRPTVLVSVLAHGGLVAAGLWAIGVSPGTRPAAITGFISEEWSGTVDVEEVPPAPEVPRESAPGVAEPRPMDVPVAQEEEAELEWADERPALRYTDFGRVPVGLRTRPAHDALVASAASPVPVVVAPAAPAQVAQRAGAGPTRGATPVGNHKPPYPPEALRRGWQGVVYVVVTVREDGTVGDVRLDASSGYGLLDDTAVRAAWTWRYEPRLVDGMPARDLLRVPVEFRIR